MEKIAFRGKMSGFLMIGEEHTEYEGTNLISYYAKPFCTRSENSVPNCIEYENGEVTIRDVRSPESDEYHCLWEQADIESALDRLGAETKYIIKEISCEQITELILTTACQGIRSDAFTGSRNLYKLICIGEPNFIGHSPGNLYICSAENYLKQSSRNTKVKAHSIKNLRELLQYLPLERTVSTFKEKTFVLTGEFGDYYHDALHNMIPVMGGTVSKNVSCDTDYLIVYGCTCMTEKMTEAIAQKEQGHSVKVVLFEDIAESLHIRLDQADKENFTKLKRYMWEFSDESEDRFIPVLNSGKGEKCVAHSPEALYTLMQKFSFINSVPEFEGTVFTPVGSYCEDYLIMTHRIIERMGGELFAAMNPKTDIIIAYGCKSMTKPFRDAAINTKTNGKTIRVILFEELAKQLDIPLLEEDQQNYAAVCRELEQITNKAETAGSSKDDISAENAPAKFKYKKSSPWWIGKLKEYHKRDLLCLTKIIISTQS